MKNYDCDPANFPSAADIRRNLGLRQETDAVRPATRESTWPISPSAASAGYAGVDLPSLEGYDWDLLEERSGPGGDRAGPGTWDSG